MSGRPRDLAGKTVGVSGLPSDPAFLKAIVEDDGGDYAKVKQVTIGFNAVSRLLTKRVDAVPAFWNAEGVVLKARGLDAKEFRVEDYGAPPYPEVVLVTSRKTLETKRAEVEAALNAIRGGVAATRKDPDAAVAKIAKAAESDDTPLVRRQLDAVLRAVRGRLEGATRRARRLGGLRRAHRARQDAPGRREDLRFRPLNARRPNAVTVRAAIDQCVVASKRASGAAEPSMTGLSGPPAGQYELAVRRINHVYAGNGCAPWHLTQP